VVLDFGIDAGAFSAKISAIRQRSSVAEQGTHKPLVAGSNPAVATKYRPSTIVLRVFVYATLNVNHRCYLDLIIFPKANRCKPLS
jgi:hypothetical protein